MQRAREKVPEKYRKQWEAVQDQKAMDALYRAIYWSSQIWRAGQREDDEIWAMPKLLTLYISRIPEWFTHVKKYYHFLLFDQP